MAAAAVGLQVRGWIPFASTYGAFWSRAFDFIGWLRSAGRTNDRVGSVEDRLAASLALARVGRGAAIIDWRICVATIVGARWACLV